ncbi:hypothetical protein HanHA89_Chr05g0204611 [Helianthus annuus]|nr:hypothetical protein HanHA89_Chr05g0204611 [Helianthus annuus]
MNKVEALTSLSSHYINSRNTYLRLLDTTAIVPPSLISLPDSRKFFYPFSTKDSTFTL